MMIDILALKCIPFVYFPILAFVVVFGKQYTMIDGETNRLVVLSTRVALFLPLYAMLIYISLCIPILYKAIEVPTALIEGYSFYTLFALLVTNLGGPNETLNSLIKSEKQLKCSFCCPKDKEKFYRIAICHVHHFLFIRPVFVFLSVVCSYLKNDMKILQILSMIFSFIALIQLILGVASVVALCKYTLYYLTFSMRLLFLLFQMNFCIQNSSI